MANKWMIIAVAVVATAVGFLFESAGPVGSMIWPVAEGMPDPEAAALGLLMLMGVVEALAFGVGVAFLVFGWAWVKRVSTGRTNAILVYLATAWLLVNWVPHTALHMSHGNITSPADYWGLVGIEYGFHATLVISGCIIAAFVIRVLQARASMEEPMAAATAKAKSKAA